MTCLGLSAGSLSLLGQILIVACVCSAQQNGIHTEDRKANDTATPPTGLRLILVRHAEAYRNLPGRQSVPDSMLDTLTPRGIKQADAVGKALKEDGEQVATVLTAPTGRASQTAALLMKALGLRGNPVKAPAVDACQPDETNADKAVRIMGAIARLEKEYPGKTAVIVTHWHLIQCALDRAAAQNQKNGTDNNYQCPPGSMTVLHIDKDAWRIEKKPELIGALTKNPSEGHDQPQAE